MESARGELLTHRWRGQRAYRFHNRLRLQLPSAVELEAREPQLLGALCSIEVEGDLIVEKVSRGETSYCCPCAKPDVSKVRVISRKLAFTSNKEITKETINNVIQEKASTLH